MKRLSLRAAQRCETAKTKTCRCRCGGLLHGSARGVDHETLPKDDPHFALPKGKRVKWIEKLPLYDPSI